MSLTIPIEPLYIVDIFQKAGFDIYIVGGAVRDLLLQAKNKQKNNFNFDFDFTTNATPEQIQKLLPDSFYENEFGTVAIADDQLRTQMGLALKMSDSLIREKIIDLSQATKLHSSLSPKNDEDQEKIDKPNFEITTYRSDEVYANHRQPESLKWGETITQDLSRRDFTINAMALKIDQSFISSLFTHHNSMPPESVTISESDYALIDLFAGINDLDQGIIKTVGVAKQRFEEDALRMLRAIRFCVQLNMQIDDDTFAAIIEKKELLKHISLERISEELLKILKSDYPAEGIHLLDQTGLLTFIIPELLEGKGVQQGGHHDSDVWTHSLDSLRHCPSADPIVRLATLLHDIGKPATYQIINDNITFYNHEIVGSRIAKNIALRLKFSKKEVDRIFLLVRFHMFYYQPQNTDASIRRFMRKVGLENIDNILALREGDRLGSGARKTSWRLEEMKQRMVEQLHQPLDVTDLKVNGHDLMDTFQLKPGPILGKILNYLFEKILDEPSLNQKEKLLEIAKEYLGEEKS